MAAAGESLEEFLAFAAQLPCRDIYEVIRSAGTLYSGGGDPQPA